MRKTLIVLAALALAAGSASAYEGGAVTGGGSITGKVKLTGPKPAAKKITPTKDQEVCGKEKTAQDFMVSADGGIKNAIVRITDIAKGKKLEVKAEPLDQKGCDYTPHIVLVPQSSGLEILNSDGILHNVHTYANKNPSFNKAMPKFKKQLSVEGSNFAQAETIEVRCDAHEWMGAWIQVIDHPYYAVTGADGSFTLADVPAGKYTIEVWHEKLGRSTKDVNVEAGKAATADFALAKK